jgi:fumarylpyruvate hydrolase
VVSQPPPFNTFLGIAVERREDGTGAATVDLAPHHLNRRGVAHGGVVAALLDSALGAAVIGAIPAEWWCATTSLSIQFQGGAGDGRLLATGRVTRRGGRVAFASGEVRDARDQLLATGHGTWHLWPHRPGPEGPAGPAGAVVVRGTGERIRVGKILAVGRNYAAHAAEMGAGGAPPVFFLKPASALASGGGPLSLPLGSGELHHEVELVVVIGHGGKAIDRARALEHVRGYAVGLDLTLREVQAEAKRRGDPWALAKGFDGAAPVSLVAPRGEVGDGSGLEITLDVNGERRQSGNTSQMVHGVADLIAHVSGWMTLEPGDLLFTGTPAGVGPLREGDRVEARIERVGGLSFFVERA